MIGTATTIGVAARTVSLPSERQRLTDLHHLIWPKPDIRQIGLAAVESLGCAKARNIDSMAHSLIHDLYLGVMALADEFTRISLAIAIEKQIQRHESRQCGCYQAEASIRIDAFTLKPVTILGSSLPDCRIIAVDRGMFRIMKRFYSSGYPLEPEIENLFAERCRNGRCGKKCRTRTSRPIQYPGSGRTDLLQIPA